MWNARLYKSYIQVAVDNCFTLFERDLSNSSSERIIFKDSAHIACYSLERLAGIIKSLVIESKNASYNIEKNSDCINSQIIMNQLIKEGKTRKEAHDIAQTKTT